MTVDTLRADHLSAWGYGRPTTALAATPEQREQGVAHGIDDLAREGVVFARAFAPRAQTFPALASLLTGRPPLETCALENRDLLPQEAVTLAEILRADGFRTAAFTANQLLAPESGIGQGFEVLESFGPQEGLDRDRAVIAAAFQWVTEREPDERTFLWLHFIGPHLSYDPEPLGDVDFRTLFTDPHYAGEATGDRETLDAAYLAGRAWDGQDLNQIVALYDGEVARVDRMLRTFLDYYWRPEGEEPGQRWKETLLVFTADHGEELYQRNGYWAHSKSVYDSTLHVPLFVRHPASLTGRRVIDEVVELQDVMPMLLDWFDLPLPAGVRGRSLLPLVDSYREQSFDSRPAFATWKDRIFTARTERWRLVWNPDGIEPDSTPPGPYPVPRLALFDSLNDPLERFDVAAAHPEVAEELRLAIADWLAGLEVCDERAPHLSAERRAALRDLGYLGDDDVNDDDVTAEEPR